MFCFSFSSCSNVEIQKTAQRKMERKMLNINCKRKYRAQRSVKEQNWHRIHSKQKWKWAGHVLRMKDSRWTKRCTEWQPRRGKRSTGQPSRRRQDDRKWVSHLEQNSIRRTTEGTDGGLQPAADGQRQSESEYKDFKGSGPEWYISTVYHAWDTPFWPGTLDLLKVTYKSFHAKANNSKN